MKLFRRLVRWLVDDVAEDAILAGNEAQHLEAAKRVRAGEGLIGVSHEFSWNLQIIDEDDGTTRVQVLDGDGVTIVVGGLESHLDGHLFAQGFIAGAGFTMSAVGGSDFEVGESRTVGLES